MVCKKLSYFIILVIAILAVTYIFRDWFLFFSCDGVKECVEDNSNYQHITKFMVTSLSVVLILLQKKNFLNLRDFTLMISGFLVLWLADFSLKILNNFNIGQIEINYTTRGIFFFIIVQCLFILRHTRTSAIDTKFPLPYVIIFVVFLLADPFFFMGKIPLLALVVIVYACALFSSLFVALKIKKNSFFPEQNKKLIFWGMICFFMCDVNVGLSLIPGDSHTLAFAVATITNNLVWMFYTPALVLLALSVVKFKD
ncbi:MAG: hypothetical protein HUK21_04845 [Fibrobacteraceae bacterium]|nr:hypothetical protein [Fibrobacteraceae bacterium]